MRVHFHTTLDEPRVRELLAGLEKENELLKDHQIDSFELPASPPDEPAASSNGSTDDAVQRP